MADNFREWNKVSQWALKCFEMKEGQKGVTLNCCLNGKKNEDGTYPKGLPLKVFCGFNSCDIVEDDYTNSYILVDGKISVGEYTKQDGTKMPVYTIFADRVVKRTFD